MDHFRVDDILTSYGEIHGDETEQVIYGVTDRSKQSLWVRLNDAWIDRQKVPIKEKSYFFHLLAVMLDAGIPMLQSLRVLANKSTNERFRRVISTMAHYVEGGRPLSEAMAKFPTVFDDAEIGVVRSGEAIGRLDQMMAKLSKQLERTYNIHLKVRGAMTYPIVVLVVLALATLVVMTLVVPKLEVFFDESGVSLPWLTEAVLLISHFVSEFWWVLVLGIMIFMVLGNLFVSTRSGRLKFDYWMLKIPFVGPLLQQALITKFVRLLGVMAASGLPINKALKILGDSMGNMLYRMKVREVVHGVEKGGKISENLATTPFLFPTTVTQMLSIGENSATLDQACEKLADHYELEIEHSIKNITTVMEPALIVFVGAAVAVLALAILGPVFSLSELV
ncbi:type II secretion system F family protein [Candidatus Peregrinibacteria bacterium]|jgi:type II secretory pathway component PulF|nr:type II secretion system F family protein [Candidatus Peregrinibacteria bacterium]MBT7483399.1 type II secretion system F family protein [Candidatus Peregrinibacteria bacterium]MBT7703751.1 type II secretion system F family protein [Candidatus Peregrinibacteria bacterium]